MSLKTKYLPNLAPTNALTAVENKLPDHSKYITTPEFNKLTTQKVTTRFKKSKFSN